jgi:hypothetical protein
MSRCSKGSWNPATVAQRVSALGMLQHAELASEQRVMTSKDFFFLKRGKRFALSIN